MFGATSGSGGVKFGRNTIFFPEPLLPRSRERGLLDDDDELFGGLVFARCPVEWGVVEDLNTIFFWATEMGFTFELPA